REVALALSSKIRNTRRSAPSVHAMAALAVALRNELASSRISGRPRRSGGGGRLLLLTATGDPHRNRCDHDQPNHVAAAMRMSSWSHTAPHATTRLCSLDRSA